jgi:hypothetical protein
MESADYVIMPQIIHRPNRLLCSLQRHNTRHNNCESLRQVPPIQLTGERLTTVRLLQDEDGSILTASARPSNLDRRMPLRGHPPGEQQSVEF